MLKRIISVCLLVFLVHNVIPVESVFASNNSNSYDSLYSTFVDGSSNTEIDFYYADFDGNGTYEAFGVTGVGEDGLYNNVEITYITSDRTVVPIDTDSSFYGLPLGLLSVDNAKFLLWSKTAGGSGATTYLFGVKNGTLYQPKVSGTHDSFYYNENMDCYIGTTSNFSHNGHEYIPSYYEYDMATGEFIPVNENSISTEHGSTTTDNHLTQNDNNKGAAVNGFEILGMCYSTASEINDAPDYSGSASKDGYYLAMQGSYLGLIDLSGNWVAPAKYLEIGYNYEGRYGLDDGTSTPWYTSTDSYVMDTYSDIYFDTLDESGAVIQFLYDQYYFYSPPVNYGISWDDTNRCFNYTCSQDILYELEYSFGGTIGVNKLRAVDEYETMHSDPNMHAIYYEFASPYKAIATDGKLKTDFIFEDIRAYSDGLIAVKQGGKWGYANADGSIVIPCEYEAIRHYTLWRGVDGATQDWGVAEWDSYQQELNDEMASLYDNYTPITGYTFPADCTDGYVVLFDGKKYALYNHLGKEVIPFGEYEELSEVYDGRLWVKQDGEWSVLNLTDYLSNNTGDEKYVNARDAWVQQHQDYALSNEFKEDITQGFNGALQDSFNEICSDRSIKTYNTLDSVNQVLDFDLNFSTSQEYELLLAQIFFSKLGAQSIEEIYNEHLSNSLSTVISYVLSLDDLQNIADSKELKLIINSIKNASGTEELSSYFQDFCNFIDGYSNINFKTEFIKEVKDGVIQLPWDIAIDELDLVSDTIEELAMYIAVGDAYAKTAGTFGDVVLAMRRELGIPSDDARFNPINLAESFTNQNIWEWANTGLPGSQHYQSIQVPIEINSLATALENFYLSIESCKNEDSSYLAENAVSNLKHGTTHNVLVSTGINAAVSLFSCLPVIREYSILKDTLKVGQSLIDTFTKLDDRAALGTMVMRLYCIECIHYASVYQLSGNSVQNIVWDWAGDSNADSEPRSAWDFYNPLSSDAITQEEFRFSCATNFDQSINVYKSIQSVAADYAIEYYSTLWAEENASFFVSDKKLASYISAISKLKQYKLSLQSIQCHNPNLIYDETTNSVYYNSPDLSIYVIACPVDMIVTNENGKQIAYLTGNINDIESGYESYFHVTESKSNFEDYMKAAIIPSNWTVSVTGTASGSMNTYVADYTNNTIGATSVLLNVSVSGTSEGQIKLTAPGQFDLIIDNTTYSSNAGSLLTDSNSTSEATVWIVASISTIIVLSSCLVFVQKRKCNRSGTHQT